MQVRKLDTTQRRDVNQFIRLPYDLYRDNAQWVPTMVPEMKTVLNRNKHPFYQHGDAEFFVVEDGGKTLARVGVLDNQRCNEYRGRRECFFCYFECVDDLEVAQRLFDAAFDWARRRGLTSMAGPKALLAGDGVGLLVEGFEHRPAVGIPYNLPYYEKLVRSVGFEKETDFQSGFLQRGHELSPRLYDIADRVKERRGYSIKSFASKKELREWVPRIGKVYNDSFVNAWEYCPITDAELAMVGDRLISVSDPRTIKLVMKGDEVIGFAFGFIDISAAIQKTGGRLWPFGWIHLMREFKRTKWINFNGVGLLPPYQGSGANSILYTEMAKTLKEFDLDYADFAQIQESNVKSLGDMAAIGVQWYKRHRLFRQSL